MGRFELEGDVYYQQGRKCGRPGCRCAQGDLHGPYWYRRDTTSGQVAYVGKGLLPEVASARKYHDLLLAAMVAERRRLIEQADALARLIRNAALSAADRKIVEALGFGAALVQPGSLTATQDGEAALVCADEPSGAQAAQDGEAALVPSPSTAGTQDGEAEACI